MGVFSTTNYMSAATKITSMIPSPFLTMQRKETPEKNFQLVSFVLCHGFAESQQRLAAEDLSWSST